MAFDPSKLASALAPTLGAVAGAYAAPGQPGLGASIGAGLGSALFTSEEEKQALRLRGLQIEGAEQNLKQGELSMLATKQAMDLNRAQDARATSREEREKTEFGLNVQGKQEDIKGKQFANQMARQDFAFNSLAPAYMGGEANGKRIVAELYQQQYGVAPTPEKMATMSSNPSVMALVKLQGAYNVIANINTKDEDSRLAGTRYLSSAGLTAKWDGEKLSIVDQFGSVDKDGNGVIDAADLKAAKDELLKSIGTEMKYAEVAEAMLFDPQTAAVGKAATQIALGHMAAGDSSPNERGVAGAEEVVNKVGREVVAASGTIRAAMMYATTDPEKAAIAVQKFDASFGGKGYDGFMDPTTGQIMVRVAKAAPWVKQNLDALKATGAVQEDDSFITMNGDRFANIVDSQLKAATLAATPKKSEITAKFNENMMGTGMIFTPATLDEKGRVKEPEANETVGAYMRREFFNRAKAALAGDGGTDGFKFTNDELEKFQKSPQGQAIMQELNNEVFLRRQGMADAADAKGGGQAKSQLELLNQKMAETRQAAIGKQRGGLIDAYLDYKGIPSTKNPDAQALSALAADQSARRKAAGGEPSSLLSKIARERMAADYPEPDPFQGMGP